MRARARSHQRRQTTLGVGPTANRPVVYLLRVSANDQDEIDGFISSTTSNYGQIAVNLALVRVRLLKASATPNDP